MRLRKPMTANFKVIVKHDFEEGEYLLKVDDGDFVGNFIVDEVISSEKIKVRAVLEDGNVNPACQTVSGDELRTFFKNRIANEMVKELMQGNYGKQ